VTDLSGLDDVRAAIARNCDRYADEPAVSSAAADLIITMRRTTTALQTAMEAYARKYDLSPSKIIIVMALAAASDHTLAQGEIARQLAVSAGSLTALVTSLEEAGIVKRTAGRSDRRVANVSLTARGVALVKRFAPEHYRCEAVAVSALSEREQRTLVRLLDKLRLHLASPPVGGSEAG
jgi:DNA-binding MarR family transcriptional regulator